MYIFFALAYFKLTNTPIVYFVEIVAAMQHCNIIVAVIYSELHVSRKKNLVTIKSNLDLDTYDSHLYSVIPCVKNTFAS